MGPSANKPKGAKIRPTPSAFMMNGPMWSLGFESALKSGTSLPTHFCAVSFHQTWRRDVSHGLPSRSQEARLYSTRRLAGHDHAQFWCTPISEGSDGSRRAVRFPASV